MKFNKIVALALALVMVFALCACGGGNTDTKTDDTGSASKVDTNTVSVGAIVIARDDVPTDEIYAFVPPSLTISTPSPLSTPRARS